MNHERNKMPRWRRRGAFVLATVLAGVHSVAVAQAVSGGLPTLGDGLELSAQAERRLGDKVVRELYRDPDYLDDVLLVDYVAGIWELLLKAARNDGALGSDLDEAYAWRLLLGKDRSINAFALPGGYVGVHLGLVARVSRRDELAAVLAHELSHITQRHIARSLGRQQAQSPWLAAAMVLGMLAATKSTQAGTAVIAGGQAVATQNQLNFSRDMEREADRVGFAVLQQAGFTPQGMVRMFQMLQQANRLQDSGEFPYLRSHPLTTERIADAQARAGLPASSPPQEAGPDVAALWMGARAAVWSDTGVDALRERIAATEAADMKALPTALQAQRWYAASLAALALRDGARAAQAWQRLDAMGLNGLERYFHRLLGVEIVLGQEAAGFAPSQAQAWLAQARALQGNTRAVVVAQARLDMALQQPARAVQDVQLWLADHPLDASAWELLGQALQQSQRAVYAVYAQAQASAARLDYASAVQKLQAAQELARQPGAQVPHQEASMVDARLRQLQALAREQTIER